MIVFLLQNPVLEASTEAVRVTVVDIVEESIHIVDQIRELYKECTDWRPIEDCDHWALELLVTNEFVSSYIFSSDKLIDEGIFQLY